MNTFVDMTRIHVLMDNSGSMHSIKEDSIGGYNEFLRIQKNAENVKELLWSFSTFNTYCENQFIDKCVLNVEPLSSDEFTPRGGTALYDAIGTILNNTIEKSKESYIIVIITDGLENSSRKYTAGAIKDMIENKTSASRTTDCAVWDFVYLGANQDSILEASKIGIKSGSTINYEPNQKSVKAVYNGVSNAITRKMSQEDEFVNFLPLERSATQTDDNYFPIMDSPPSTPPQTIRHRPTTPPPLNRRRSARLNSYMAV